MRKLWFILLILPLIFGGCKPESDPNPYDGVGDLPDVPVDSLNFEPWDFAALQRDVFSPTCANSGCHDGTFEPDFRTIESSYNTLVNHPIIKNNPAGTYEHRVVPGNLGASMLWLRLNEDIDGISGIMPLVETPEWEQNRSTHLNNIRTWIENGAPDMVGNPAPTGNFQPGFLGVYAEADGIPCDISARILVPQGAQTVKVWVALEDKETPISQLSYNKVRMATNALFSFDTVTTEFDLLYDGPGITQPSAFGNPVQYHHYFVFTANTWPQEPNHYFRVFVKDPMHAENTELPQDGSALHIKQYFSWRFDL